MNDFKPSLVVGQERTGAILARLVGQRIGVASLAIPKDSHGIKDSDLVQSIGEHRSNVVIIEDNVTTGRSVSDVRRVLLGADCAINTAASVFNSSSITADQLGLDTFSSMLNLNIQHWYEDECILCSHHIPLETPAINNPTLYKAL